MSWQDELPEALAPLRDAAFFKAGEDGAVKPLEQVISDLSNAAQHLGNSIRMPGPDAGESDIAEFQGRVMEKVPGLMAVPNPDDNDGRMAIFNKLGRPETSEDYKLPEIAGIDWSQHNMGQTKARAHQYGMTQPQFTQMITDQMTDSTSAQESATHELGEQVAALKQEWGAGYEARIAKVKGLLDSSGAPEELTKGVNSGSLNAASMRWLYAMADSLGSEGKELTNHGKQGEITTTPEEALEQLNELERRPELWDAASPDHKRLVNKRVDLMRLAYPEQSSDIDSLRA